MRDNFTKKIKNILAKRVAWRCSFPGCGIITIGPGHLNSESVINLGEAAHIHAASENGPRYDERMTKEQRMSIDNGIWMCRHHATLIDSDFINYSAETIRQWKILSEQETYRLLQRPERKDSTPTTLVALGKKIVFEGIWKAVKDKTWVFKVNHFIIGTESELLLFNDNQQPIADKYIVVESQGDGRMINGNVNWNFVDSCLEISLEVEDKTARTTPYELGDLALDEELDLAFEDGDLKMVKGEECAKQIIMLTLSSNFGDMWYAPTFGSFFSEYYKRFKDSPEVLKRLIKLEITRLLSIPHLPAKDKSGKPLLDLMSDEHRPPLDFINRVANVDLVNTYAADDKIIVKLRLEWGDGKHWENAVPIYVK